MHYRTFKQPEGGGLPVLLFLAFGFFSGCVGCGCSPHPAGLSDGGAAPASASRPKARDAGVAGPTLRAEAHLPPLAADAGANEVVVIGPPIQLGGSPSPWTLDASPLRLVLRISPDAPGAHANLTADPGGTVPHQVDVFSVPGGTDLELRPAEPLPGGRSYLLSVSTPHGVGSLVLRIEKGP